jgi:hypothetical protein
VAAVAFGVLILGVAVAPNLAAALVLLVLMGGASISFIALSNSTLQLRADPAMRGRVMALYAVAFLGSTPIGAPVVGAVAQAWGARAALALGGVATLVAAAAARRGLGAKAPNRPSDAERQDGDHRGGHEDHRGHAEAAEDGSHADDGEGADGELGRVAHEKVPPEPAEGDDRSTDGHDTSAASGSPPGPAAAGRRARRSDVTSQKVTAP